MTKPLNEYLVKIQPLVDALWGQSRIPVYSFPLECCEEDLALKSLIFIQGKIALEVIDVVVPIALCSIILW